MRRTSPYHQETLRIRLGQEEALCSNETPLPHLHSVNLPPTGKRTT